MYAAGRDFSYPVALAVDWWCAAAVDSCSPAAREWMEWIVRLSG
jgi:hypothetical protein